MKKKQRDGECMKTKRAIKERKIVKQEDNKKEYRRSLVLII